MQAEHGCVSSESIHTDVAVVGGGLSGLACAVALRDSGLRVDLFEADGTLGGRARSWIDSHSGDAIDLGPHIFLSEYRNMLALLDLLGTRDRVVWQSERLIRLREGRKVTDMHLHALPPPLHLAPSFANVRSLSWRDKLSNRRALWLAMHIDEQEVVALDHVNAKQLLEQLGVTPAFIDWFWASACMTVLNVPLDQCSAGALLRVFSQLVGLREYCIGFADSGLADLFAPPAARLITAAGGRIHTDATVTRIECEADRVTQLVLDDGTHVHTRFCVAAVPPQSLAPLVPSRWQNVAPFQDLAVFEPSPYISNYLWFDRKLSDERFWARIWNPKDLNSDFYDLSNIRQGWRERESVIASNIIYSHRAHHMSNAEITAATLQEIREALPAAAHARVRQAVVNRIDMAIPCPMPGTESKRPPAATPIQGLLLAGDWTRTALPASMESAVHSGYSAAEAIWRDIGQPRAITLSRRPTEGLAGLVYAQAKARPRSRAYWTR
jgi:zeta-carotene desaturase